MKKLLFVFQLILTFQIQSQSIVKGTVVDLDGQPIEGALIFTDSISTQSNRIGSFTILVYEGTDVINIHHLGYSKTRVSLGYVIGEIGVIRLMEDLWISHPRKFGMEKGRFSNGRRAYKIKYKNGLKNGLGKYFYLNGKLKLVGYYKDGLRNGKWKFIDKEGLEFFFNFHGGYNLIQKNQITPSS